MNNNELKTTVRTVEPEVVVLRMSSGSMINYNYLIIDPVSRQAVLVDPAWQIGKIEQALVANRVMLSGILITHSHPDHIDLAEPLATRHRCPIWMSYEEIKASKYYSKKLSGIDESMIMVGEMKVQPILTPGHTKGSVCYLIGENIFTGDTLFAEACGMCPDIPSAETLYQSMQRLKVVLRPNTRVYPGHSYGKAPGRLFSKILKENIYLQFNNSYHFSSYLLRGQKRSKMFNFS